MDKASILELILSSDRDMIFGGIGKCMSPMLQPDDLFRIRRCPKYRVGEIVAIRENRNNPLRLHRLVKIKGGDCITKGDHTQYFETTQACDIMGKLVAFLPKGSSDFVEYNIPNFVSRIHAALSYTTRGKAQSSGKMAKVILMYTIKAFRISAIYARKYMIRRREQSNAKGGAAFE